MLNKNSISTGILLGIILPIVGLFFWHSVFELLSKGGIMNPDGFSFTWRERTTSLLAICMNLIPFQLYKNRRYEQSMRGLIFPTVIFVIIWVYYFRAALLID